MEVIKDPCIFRAGKGKKKKKILISSKSIYVQYIRSPCITKLDIPFILVPYPLFKNSFQNLLANKPHCPLSRSRNLSISK